MSCADCEKRQQQDAIAYYRWKTTNIAMQGCDKHLREIFDVLSNYQRQAEKGA